MESLSDSYERYTREIHFLKKQINGEKNAHENSLKQLQSAYEIIDELKEMLRMEQANNLKLKAEAKEKGNRLVAISNQYEQQIGGIKELIDVKDEQLRRLSSALLVSDADLIRLKIVNQLQLAHKEQMEALHKQISKRDNELAQIKSKLKTVNDKYEFLNMEVLRQQEEASFKNEDINRKYMSEIKQLYEAVERSKSQRDKWHKKYETLEVKFKRQSQRYRSEVSKLNHQLQVQNRAILSNGGSKSDKIKLQKLQAQSIKMQDQLQEQREVVRKLENQIANLKREIKILKQSQAAWQSQKDQSEETIKELQRQIQTKQNQKRNQIEQIKRNFQNGGLQGYSKGERQRTNRLETENKRLKLKIQNQQEQMELLREQLKEGGFAAVKRQLHEKNSEIQKLLLEVESQKKRDRTKSSYQGREDVGSLKRKLVDANEKIVSLLREKVELHKELKQYRIVHDE